MSQHHYGARVREYTEHGFSVLSLENELIKLELRLDNGGEIISFLHKQSDTDFLWHRPVATRSAPVQSIPRGTDEHVFNDRYIGGWQECFPNGGPNVLYKGAELPFHGELLNLPFNIRILEDTSRKVSVLLYAETLRTPFLLEKTLTLHSEDPRLQISEKMTNLSDIEFETMWGHHPAFGPPFLDSSCRIDFPACRCTTKRSGPWPGSSLVYGEEFDWPMAPLKSGGKRDLSIIPGPESKTTEIVFLSKFQEGWYGITNQNKKLGFGLSWDPGLFKYVWFWSVFGGFDGYPWYGRNYNFALEPWTSMPESGLLEAINNGTALSFAPGESKETKLCAVVYSGVDRIRGISPDGRVHF